jgi:acetyl-CoA carboxylase biotin carboxyl carrier protein
MGETRPFRATINFTKGTALDLQEVKQLIDLMKESDLNELEIEQKDLKLRIRRGPSGQVTTSTGAGSHPPALPGASPEQLAAPQKGGEGAAQKDEDGVIYVKSPMVGTFYRSPSPESPPYVEPGQKVTESTVVCIIEAMKVMNEIHADVKGTVLEVLVESGQPVEYGEPLYKVKKA